MCEYCGCQESVRAIAELTTEHDVVVDLAGRAAAACREGDVDAAGALARRIHRVLQPHTAVEEHGLFPALAGDFPDHVEELEREHRMIDSVLHEATAGTPRDPSWPARLLDALHLLREHILREQDGVFPAALAVLDADGWERVDEVRRRVGSGLTAV